MRYAVISDIHANLQAWNAVLLDIRSSSVDEIICLGDIVGYGPNPREVLESVYAHVHHFVLGNHDAAVCDMIDCGYFNRIARELILWTRGQLNPAAHKFLHALPLSLLGEGFRCVHGEFGQPGRFEYVVAPEEAVPSWQAVDEPLLFVGHTHLPGIFLLGQSGVPHLVAPQDFVLEPEKRFLVNVGSVGQPRDEDARASYCIYDSARSAVFWRRIPFDIDAYEAAVEAAHLPADASLLAEDPRRTRDPVRFIQDFSPGKAPEKGVTDAVEVQTLKHLRKGVRKWRTLAAGLLGLCLLSAGGAGWLWHRYGNRSAVIAGERTAPLSAAAVAVDANVLSAPPADPVPPGRPVPGWRIRLGDRRRQSVAVETVDGSALGFVLRSQAAGVEMAVLSPDITITPDMRFCLEAFLRKSADFDGHVHVVVSLVSRPADNPGRLYQQNIVKAPTWKRKDDWLLAKQTFDAPDGAEFARFQIQGRFTGTVWVLDPALYRRR
ncbi:MAG: metallophosphoesterase family protein [Kiritimatiellae bacterium]|nr:metallophosphoesterase family protein [Kiritimatiellia bacterium]